MTRLRWQPRAIPTTGTSSSAALRSGPAYRHDRVYGRQWQHFGDARFFAQPSIAFRQTYPTANWTLSYTPGVSVSQHAADSTQFTHNLAGDVFWKATPHWTLHARQDYSISTNPFESVGRVALLPDLGGYFGPNYDGVIPDSKRTTWYQQRRHQLSPDRPCRRRLTGGYQRFELRQHRYQPIADGESGRFHGG